MDATNQRSMRQASQRNESMQVRGVFGNISERTAQILATLITVGVFGSIAYSLDLFFSSLAR